MKKIILLLLLFTAFIAKGQNLVPNPSFEQYDTCPNNFCQISYCIYWHSFSQSPDYFNECAPIIEYWWITPPNCYYGFQYPHSGDAYVGLCPFHSLYSNYREFIGTQLVSPLMFKQKYFITFYINLSGNTTYGATIASNKMGIKFSTILYPYSYSSNPALINNYASFYCNTIITDTLHWVKISGSFIADSTYTYLMIGNFFDDSHTDTLNLAESNNNYAYYYIDDVCLSTDSLYCANWTGIEENSLNKKEKLVVYPNPAYDNIIISTKSNENISGYTISDLTGRIVINKIPVSPFNKIESDISALAVGTYIVNVATASNYYTLKFVKIK